MPENKNIKNEVTELLDLLEKLKMQNPTKFNRIFGKVEGLLESNEVFINEKSI